MALAGRISFVAGDFFKPGAILRPLCPRTLQAWEVLSPAFTLAGALI